MREQVSLNGVRSKEIRKNPEIRLGKGRLRGKEGMKEL